MRSRRGAKGVQEKRVIAVSANTAFALSNYRIGLMKALVEAAFDVVALVPDPEAADRLRAEGIDIRRVPIEAHGTSTRRDLKLLAAYLRLFREIRPIAFLGFTIKPNIYGSLAAGLAGVPAINNITGLGMVFTNGGMLQRIVSRLYETALRRSFRVFFQNRESRELFVTSGLVREEQTALLPGSGVDLDRFAPPEDPRRVSERFTFLLASRLMWQKGVGEYAEAARWFRANRPEVDCKLIGAVEPVSNKDAIPSEKIAEWQQQGLIYEGVTSDVRPFISAADCVLLPSYYPEGVPRILIEAAAMGKPIVTADMPGCREVVEPGVTGELCEPRSAESLLSAMQRMVARSAEEIREMGAASRAKAERDFDERIVIDAYLGALRGCIEQTV